jgi:hypothetical protein
MLEIIALALIGSACFVSGVGVGWYAHGIWRTGLDVFHRRAASPEGEKP